MNMQKMSDHGKTTFLMGEFQKQKWVQPKHALKGITPYLAHGRSL